METEIIIKEWSVRTKEDKSKTISGVYSVLCGANELATSKFNSDYDSVDIKIPAGILSEIEAIDEKVRTAIIKNFTG